MSKIKDNFNLTPTFKRLDKSKQDRIIKVAVKEFARNGYAATKVTVIANYARISIGSFYSYFPSKEALFLAVVKAGYQVLKQAAEEIKIEGNHVLFNFRQAFDKAVAYADSHPDFCKIYLDLTREQFLPYSEALSQYGELSFLETYTRILKQAVARAEIKEDTDIALLAYELDNMVVMLQFALMSNYYKRRLELYLGLDLDSDKEVLIEKLLSLVALLLKLD